MRLSKQHGVNPCIRLCVFCGEEDGIALMGALPNDEQAPREAVLDDTPCSDCQSLMDQGITIAEATERPNNKHIPTGRWIVITEDAFKEWMLPIDKEVMDKVVQMRRLYVDPPTFNALIPDAEEEANDGN